MVFNKLILFCFASAACMAAHAQAIIDPDVSVQFKKSSMFPVQHSALLASLVGAPQADRPMVAVMVFLNSKRSVTRFAQDMQSISNMTVKRFDVLPVVTVTLPNDHDLLQMIARHPDVMQISAVHAGQEELETAHEALLLKPSAQYPDVSNWWANGYTGAHSVIGVIDSGIDSENPSLREKTIVVRQEPGSGYDVHKNGVNTPHGTGVACIYAGLGNNSFPNDYGIAVGIPTFVTALAGEQDDGEVADLLVTLGSLDWMLNRSGVKPTIINYSFGNGPTSCSSCTDWSGIAKVFDYVVNHDHIFIVKSAGNQGYGEFRSNAPFAGTLTTPADNYNAVTVANMDITASPDRAKHVIDPLSSRGPTLNGRRKPDISAPGTATRTCAPDPSSYAFSYTASMDYRDGFRFMGGTSAATPHVGAAAALLEDAGITSPMAKKALLINSADAYTDGDSAACSASSDACGPVMGSEWNRSYGWGYLNMQRAFDERNYLIQDSITMDQPEKTYEAQLPVGAKITLVHERRIGYDKVKTKESGKTKSTNMEWALSHLSLEIVDKETGQVVMRDASENDTVHQVANCIRAKHEKRCSDDSRPIQALITVKLSSSHLDGAAVEPFVLASSVPLR